MTDEQLDALLNSLFNDPPEVFSEALNGMSEMDRMFFDGFVKGYVAGSRAAQQAISEDFDKIPADEKTSRETARE